MVVECMGLGCGFGMGFVGWLGFGYDVGYVGWNFGCGLLWFGGSGYVDFGCVGQNFRCGFLWFGGGGRVGWSEKGRKEKRDERIDLFILLFLYSLSYFNKLYMKIEIKMLGEL